jgi:hypothetical protein
MEGVAAMEEAVDGIEVGMEPRHPIPATPLAAAWAAGGDLHPNFRAFLADDTGMNCSESEIDMFFQGFGIVSVQDVLCYGLQPMTAFMGVFPPNWWNTPSLVSAATKLRILAHHIELMESTGLSIGSMTANSAATSDTTQRVSNRGTRDTQQRLELSQKRTQTRLKEKQAKRDHQVKRRMSDINEQLASVSRLLTPRTTCDWCWMRTTV